MIFEVVFQQNVIEVLQNLFQRLILKNFLLFDAYNLILMILFCEDRNHIEYSVPDDYGRTASAIGFQCTQ